MKIKQIYVAADGREFDMREKCIEYENGLPKPIKLVFYKYLENKYLSSNLFNLIYNNTYDYICERYYDELYFEGQCIRLSEASTFYITGINIKPKSCFDNEFVDIRIELSIAMKDNSDGEYLLKTYILFDNINIF